MGVNARKVYQKVRASWLHTIVSILVMFGILFVLLGICSEFGLSRPVLIILEGAAGFGLASFFLSEVLIVVTMLGKRIGREDYPRFYSAVEQTCKSHRMSMPRLYVVHMQAPNGDKIPNALAFGMGFFGQYAVAISDRIYELMDDEELKSILDHEIGHIRSKDVGVLSAISVVIGGTRQIGRMLTSGKTFLGKTPWAAGLGIAVLVVNRLLFPIALAAIAQEREYAADALSALDSNSPDPMIRALRKLEHEMKVLAERLQKEMPEMRRQPKGPFDELFLSHPGMDERIESLESLRN